MSLINKDIELFRAIGEARAQSETESTSGSPKWRLVTAKKLKTNKLKKRGKLEEIWTHMEGTYVGASSLVFNSEMTELTPEGRDICLNTIAEYVRITLRIINLKYKG